MVRLRCESLSLAPILRSTLPLPQRQPPCHTLVAGGSSVCGPSVSGGHRAGCLWLSQLAKFATQSAGLSIVHKDDQITWVPDFSILNTPCFLLSHARMRGNGPAFDRSTAAPYRTPLVALFGSGCCKGASRTYLVLQTTHFPISLLTDEPFGGLPPTPAALQVPWIL